MLEIYSWSGEPVCQLNLEYPIAYFAVDEEHNVIYGLNPNGFEDKVLIYRYWWLWKTNFFYWRQFLCCFLPAVRDIKVARELEGVPGIGDCCAFGASASTCKVHFGVQRWLEQVCRQVLFICWITWAVARISACFRMIMVSRSGDCPKRQWCNWKITVRLVYIYWQFKFSEMKKVMIHINGITLITCMLWNKSSAGFMPQVNWMILIVVYIIQCFKLLWGYQYIQIKFS